MVLEEEGGGCGDQRQACEYHYSYVLKSNYDNNMKAYIVCERILH